MKISNQSTDEAVLRELGERLAKDRLERNLTQAGLAEQAGVSKRTVERLEAGDSAQLSSLIRLCRALDLLAHFEMLIPEPAPSPIAQLKLRGKDRRRASAKKTPAHSSRKWEWGDE
jgi:transcriptional regulator with XRE-family HTH domain